METITKIDIENVVINKINDNFSDLENAADGKFGDVDGGDYSEFLNDGTLRYRGDATVWKDMVTDLFGRRLNSVAGTVDYDYDDNALVFSPNGGIADANDRVGGNQEINHEFKVGSNITFKPHIHWWQPVASNAVGSIVFTARYRLQRNGYAKEDDWTTITAEAGTSDDIWDFTSEEDGLYNQITRFDDITVDCGISDTLQFQLTRTDSVSGDVSVIFFDTHGMVDSDGSDDEIAKTA